MKRNISIKEGQIWPSKSCGDFEVIQVISYKEVWVRFINTGYTIKAQGGQVTDGRISDKFSPTIYGVGILGDVELPIDHRKSYKIWHSMIQRCYADSSRRNRTYSDCLVCEEWLTYSNFEKWFDEYYKDDYCLDKDLTLIGNRVYCPEYCAFVPNEINCLLIKSDKTRGSFPIGVYFKKAINKYVAQLNKTCDGKVHRVWLGSFKTPDEAFLIYKQAKEDWVKVVAEKYYLDGCINEQIYNNLIKYEVNISD